MKPTEINNINDKTVSGFGFEWKVFDQSSLPESEAREYFENYFALFPWDKLPKDSTGFDLGCGSGRWAAFVADRVGSLHCIDPSEDALIVAQTNLSNKTNCRFHLASVDNIPLLDNSMDFGYSLGVLHHIPDTQKGIISCVAKLRPGAPFLIYLYYSFDNRPVWYRAIWRISDIFRRVISSLPKIPRYIITQIIATIIYYPLARTSLFMEYIGFNIASFPLSTYRHARFYTMRTDALDRFGTSLEKRFTAEQIISMMQIAGLENIIVNRQKGPYWCAVGFKRNIREKE